MVKTLSLQEALKTLTLPGLDRNLFSSPEWLAVIVDTYSTKFFVKYVEVDGKVSSYIVYSVVKNFLEWKICICSYCDYCDGYVSSSKEWDAYFQSLREEFPRYRIAIRSLRDEVAQKSSCFKELSRERHHILDVRAELDVILRKSDKSFKSAVKQGQRSGLVVKKGSYEDLKKFYSMHLKVRKYKYRIFAQPFRFFDNMWKHFMAQDKGVLLCAYTPEGECVGANIYLICGDTLFYKSNTSTLNKIKYRPNNVLFWEGVKFAKERGINYVDCGSSGYDQKGLISFKKHTGAVMSDIIHLGYAPENYKFSQKRILKAWTWFFTRDWMPERAAALGSSIIYPFLA